MRLMCDIYYFLNLYKCISSLRAKEINWTCCNYSIVIICFGITDLKKKEEKGMLKFKHPDY